MVTGSSAIMVSGTMDQGNLHLKTSIVIFRIEIMETAKQTVIQIEMRDRLLQGQEAEEEDGVNYSSS
jgi:hypothetical protein